MGRMAPGIKLKLLIREDGITKFLKENSPSSLTPKTNEKYYYYIYCFFMLFAWM